MNVVAALAGILDWIVDVQAHPVVYACRACGAESGPDERVCDTCGSTDLVGFELL